MTARAGHLHDTRFPGESDEYRQGRDALLRAEAELRDRTEAIAEQRRQLPLGGVVPTDYQFQEWDTATGSPRAVKLSELVEEGKDTLFLHSFMFIPGPRWESDRLALSELHLDHRRRRRARHNT